MTHYVDSRQRASEAKQYAVYDAIGSHGRLAPAVLAQRELLDQQIALNAQRRALEGTHADPGPLRRWVGARILALGTRLAGSQVGLEPTAGIADDPVPIHSLS